jgi:hypothetical protein
MLTTIAAALLAAQPAPAAPPPAIPAVPGLTPRLAEAPDYRVDAAWLCLPGRVDACSQLMPTTALTASGYGATSQSAPNPQAKVDCFYVYPTVSRDPGMNSDIEPGLEEKGTAWFQLGRLASVCRTFAPIYRQLTATALGRFLATGADPAPNLAIAYGDVLSAWREFLAHRNQGRPFVLVGHSQGSIHLQKLLREEIEGKPIARKLVSALIPGWPVEVPPGKLVGGTFRSTPLCTRERETGCVLTWMTFRAESPPPQPSFLGRAAKAGMTAGCTNPAALGSDRPARLDSYWYVLSRGQFAAIPWSSEGPPPTPFLRSQGLVTGQCRHDGTAGYLAVSVATGANEKWTPRIPGDVIMLGQVNKGWGMHLIDMNVAQGDVVTVLAAQAGAAISAGATPARRSAATRPKARRR